MTTPLYYSDPHGFTNEPQSQSREASRDLSASPPSEHFNILETVKAQSLAAGSVWALLTTSKTALDVYVTGAAVKTVLPAAGKFAATFMGETVLPPVLGSLVGIGISSNHAGRALGLDHSLGHYVGLEWLGNQAGNLAIWALGPADLDGDFVAKTQALFESLYLD